MLRMNGVIGLWDTGQQTSSGQSLGKCTTGRWQGGIGFLGTPQRNMGKLPSPPRSVLAFFIAFGPFIFISALRLGQQDTCQQKKNN
jgi:hypothetical protein